MAEGDILIKDIVAANPWISGFNLRDDQILDYLDLVTQVTFGFIDLKEFESSSRVILKGFKEEDIKNLMLVTAINRFWAVKEKIKGIEEFIVSLGGKLPEEKKKESEISAPLNVSKPNFAFDEEDEEEVKNINMPENKTPSPATYDEASELIIKQFNFTDPDEVINKRLKNIIISRLRDARDDMETFEVLQKGRKVGGMEFNLDLSRQLMKLIKENDRHNYLETPSAPATPRISFPSYNSGKNKGLIDLKEVAKEELNKRIVREPIKLAGLEELIKKEAASEVSYQPLTAPVKPKMEAPKVKLEMGEEDGLPVIRMPDDLMIKPKVMPLSKPEAKEAEKEKKIENISVNQVKKPDIKKDEEPLPPLQPAPFVGQVKSLPPRTSPAGASRKPTLDDVKFVKNLYGPIEEMAYMTLIDFRRLGASIDERISKIEERIKLLESESYTKRIQAIEAWNKNEVNRFYRLLGQASMSEGRSIKEIVEARQKEGKPTLSLEEFEAVMDLNRKLRF